MTTKAGLPIGFKKSLKQIKEAGFTHIKVELEAQLDRGASDDGEYITCDNCDSGRYECNECYGRGVTEGEADNGEAVEMECEDCEGEGSFSCDTCSGDGEILSEADFSDSYCGNFILDRVSQPARQALTYGNFYNDGSVDSEYTFTVPIEKAEYVIEYINAFSTLADHIGNGIDTDGAGMHICLLTQGQYPYNNPMPSEKIRNFKTEVTKLLPALFFLATPDRRNRGFSYRYPRIDHHDKYSAIYTHNQTCLEYRVFETCYGRPTAFYDFVMVINKTLDYYRNPELKVKPLQKMFNFTDGEGIERYFKYPEQLEILNKTIKNLKPPHKPIKQLKAERNCNVKIADLKLEQRREIARHKIQYFEYLSQKKVYASDWRKDARARAKREAERTGTPAKAIYQELVKYDKPVILTFKQYLKKYYKNNSGFRVAV